MTRRGWIYTGVGAAVLGLLAMILVVTTRSGSPRSFVANRYALVSNTGDSRVYSSPLRPSQVADEIGQKWKPADRLVDPNGIFLRYSDDYIGVTPAAGGGSTIHVDDARRGYARWYPYVGGYWGSSGVGGGFRGGGPGAGK